jgi:hypothetical protein
MILAEMSWSQGFVVTCSGQGFIRKPIILVARIVLSLYIVPRDLPKMQAALHRPL